ncbi:universal stress protein [Candidatus Nitrospira neomarina]|uniref:Universal stress protein n=1 Tax=Candidatus Nitrospira neomarina TaxID=3020899 RepID=A0AA96GKQ8_9BACT|nr:universal stress protein [Candidatus Nitrospira neomarina]WNM62155.1 universal stress protein [Candidatus Nitrospira neomarina]
MRIVVPVDGSSCSTSSVHTLAHFTPPEELTLVHALHLPDFNYPMITPDLRTEAQEAIKDQLRKEGEKILDEAQKHLPADFSHVQQVHQIGHPVDVIVETARSAQSHLIVLGARGLGPIKELILGSVSHRVLMHGSCSTMIVKTPMSQLKKILLPIEGQEDAEAALQFLALQPFRQPVEVEVFAVWPQPQLSWPTTIGQSDRLEAHAIEEAQERMKTITDRLTRMNFACQAHVGIGDPAYAILEQRHASQSDLIMMGMHGRGGFSRFLMGSVSHSVLHQTPCPVLIVR